MMPSATSSERSATGSSRFDDYEPPENYEDEPLVISEVRAAARRGDLLEQLRAGLGEPVLDPDDERSRENAAR